MNDLTGVPAPSLLCSGGCGTVVTTNKCSECAARAVGEWLAGRPGKSDLATRYYGAKS